MSKPSQFFRHFGAAMTKAETWWGSVGKWAAILAPLVGFGAVQKLLPNASIVLPLAFVYVAAVFWLIGWSCTE